MHTSFLDSASSSAVFQNCLTLFNTGIRDLAETIESGPLGITNLNIFINVFKKCPDYPQKVEKYTSKMLLSYGSWKFFFCSPACPKQPRSSFLFYKFSYTFICAKICAGDKPGRGCLWDFNIVRALVNLICQVVG